MDISKIENLEILTSYDEVFIDKENLASFLNGEFQYIDALLLSLISFDQMEANSVRDWSRALFKEKPRVLQHINKTKPFNRHGRLISWKFLLSNFINDGISNFNLDYAFVKIYKVLLLTNNYQNSDGYNVEHEFVNGFLSNYRDNYLNQCYRASIIFLEKLDEKVNERFYTAFGINIEDYCRVLHFIIFFYKKKMKIKLIPTIEIPNLYLDIKEISKIFHIDTNIINRILNIISFDIECGANFSKETLKDNYEFSLFRNKPFIKLSEENYLAIDGKLVEDLMFNNLFYKIKDLYGEKDNSFLKHFGEIFESYVQEITTFGASNSVKNKYIVIPEFSYKYKKNKLKSPDLLIYNEKEKSLIVIEIKSSRYLGRVIEGNNDIESVNLSLDKTVFNPWKQAISSITKIIEVKANENVSNTEKFIIVSVSMNDFPMLAHPIEILNKQGERLTDMFFSMGIEAYEVLVELLSSDSDFSLYQILKSYNNYKGKMSIKTYLARLKKKTRCEINPFLEKIKHSTINMIKISMLQ